MSSGSFFEAVAAFALPRSLRNSLARKFATLTVLLFAISLHADAPTFTVTGNTFPSTPLGQSTTQSVTVKAAVAIKSITLQSGFTEYKLGVISG